MPALIRKPYMMRRVHRSADEHQLRAAIAEYRAFTRTYPDDALTPLLLSVADDCEEELRERIDPFDVQADWDERA